MLLVLTVAAMLLVDGYWTYKRDRDQARKNLHESAQHLAETLSPLMEHVWRKEGFEQALALLREANERHQTVTLRWVWLDAAPDSPDAPRVTDRHAVEAALRQRSSIEERKAGPAVLYTYVHSAIPDTRPGAIELAQSLAKLDTHKADFLKRTIGLFVGLLVAAAGTILLIGIYFVGRPLQLLKNKAERAGAGDLSQPLDLHGKAELSDLADVLNTMCEHLAESRQQLEDETTAKLKALEQARHTDRLRTVGRLASGIAHELGTPLNVVSGRATMIAQRRLDADQTRESAQIIIAQANRMTEIIRQLLSFARRGSADRQRCHVTEIAQQCVALVAPAAGKRGVHVVLQAPEGAKRNGLYAMCNPSEIQQVFINLLVNAIQASPPEGEVNIRLGLEPDAEGVCVSVQDHGAGIEESDLPHVFEPFFTTKDVGEGTGLGLSIAHGILEDHGGWIRVESKVGQGTCFTFHLPSADKAEKQ